MKICSWVMCVAVLALASAAHAHTHLEESIPANGATVKTAPANVVLTFAGAVRITALTLQKEEERGNEQKLEPLPSEPAAEITVPTPKLTPGTYTLSWRAVGPDNHVVSGKVQFSIEETPSPARADASSLGLEPACWSTFYR